MMMMMMMMMTGLEFAREPLNPEGFSSVLLMLISVIRH
jgi:hypothetical protein